MSKQPTAQPDPDDLINPKFNVSCLDFLLIELVPLAQRITDQVHARDQALIEQFRMSKIFNKSDDNSKTTADNTTSQQQQHEANALPSAPPTVTVTEGGTATDLTSHGEINTLDDETREALFWRLDGLGYRVGQGLAERFTANKPRPQSALDAIKFICKDLWTLLFRKQIDNLKTNHRGVFVLTDARFQPISRMSVDRRTGPRGAEEAVRRAQTYLYFPCGVIRGALSGLGLEVSVTAETMEIPAATFQIKTKDAKA